jgi:hypothetical protein
MSARNVIEGTARTLYLTYGPKTKLPQYPGDPEPASYFRYIYVQGGEPYEAANELERLGFHVNHPATHPNGSGGSGAMVYVSLKQRPLPATVVVDDSWKGRPWV